MAKKLILDIQHLGKEYGSAGATVRAIDDVHFSVYEDEIVSIVGPSGCGKTTILRCVAGLLEPSQGKILLSDKMVDSPPSELALVFQDYSRSLYPWLTVNGNIELPLRAKKVPRAERRHIARQALAEVGLADVGERYPWQLSGGMQQRVAIARAVAFHPKVLLMDEPFASVDAQTRSELEDLVLDLRRRTNMAILLVTHDIDEAVYLSDRIVVLSKGPTRVVETVESGLPAVRDQISTKELERFIELRKQIIGLIKTQPASKV